MTVIDKQHKVLYCALPKSGSTNWKLTVRLMEEMTDDDSKWGGVDRVGSNWGWTSKKDVAGYRIRRSPGDPAGDISYPIFPYSQEALNINQKSYFNEYTGLPNFKYNKEQLNKDINHPFIYKNGGKPVENNDFGQFPVSAIPPSLRQTFGRFGKNKLQQGYSYQDRIKVYTNGTYFKTIFVRHPVERLLSAYRDKAQPGFFKPRPRLHPTKGLKLLIRKDLEPEDLAEKLQELDRSAFAMFLTYVIDRGGENSGWSGITVRHWGRAFDLCRICSIDWDFIGKMDSVEMDSEKVMELVGVKDKIHLGLHQPSNDHTKVIKYFKGLPKRIAMGIYDVYETDFQVLGFTIPEWLWEVLSNDSE